MSHGKDSKNSQHGRGVRKELKRAESVGQAGVVSVYTHSPAPIMGRPVSESQKGQEIWNVLTRHATIDVINLIADRLSTSFTIISRPRPVSRLDDTTSYKGLVSRPATASNKS